MSNGTTKWSALRKELTSDDMLQTSWPFGKLVFDVSLDVSTLGWTDCKREMLCSRPERKAVVQQARSEHFPLLNDTCIGIGIFRGVSLCMVTLAHVMSDTFFQIVLLLCV